MPEEDQVLEPQRREPPGHRLRPVPGHQDGQPPVQSGQQPLVEVILVRVRQVQRVERALGHLGQQMTVIREREPGTQEPPVEPWVDKQPRSRVTDDEARMPEITDSGTPDAVSHLDADSLRRIGNPGIDASFARRWDKDFRSDPAP
jgi:hypothetical protein